jgi:hypothetical protein
MNRPLPTKKNAHDREPVIFAADEDAEYEKPTKLIFRR